MEITIVQLLSQVNELALWSLGGLGVLYLVAGCDDLFVDLVAWKRRLKPTQFSDEEFARIKARDEKNIAIMVPAWDEGSIIDRMIVGNLERLKYSNFHFFVGVYPNDPVTVNKVQDLEKRYPNVHGVVNLRNGPSSKGQILNQVVRHILDFEREEELQFDAFLMQDAEDLIHPQVLSLVNEELEKYDFIQVPVFSLEVKPHQLVAGTYMDEFAESHTKDILVREALGAAVPSAGVGTALSRSLVEGMMIRGGLFNEGSLTEDYELGLRAHALGYRPHIACNQFRNAEGHWEFVATREFFPKRFTRSIRQKTRWTTGIALQGWRNLGWVGSKANRYFLMRDRKGVVTNIATFFGYVTGGFTLAYSQWIDPSALQSFTEMSGVQVLFIGNLALMSNRMGQRIRCTYRVYGWKGVGTLPVRWPVAITVNAFAGLRAVKTDTMARFTNATLTWSKTEHELPELFGKTANGMEVAS